MKCKQHGRKAKGSNQITLPVSLFVTCLSLLPVAREKRKTAAERPRQSKLVVCTWGKGARGCSKHQRCEFLLPRLGKFCPVPVAKLNSNLSHFEQKADGNQPDQGCSAAPGDGLFLWGAGSHKFPSCEDKALPVTAAVCQDCIPTGFLLAGRHIPAGVGARQGQRRAGLQEEFCVHQGTRLPTIVTNRTPTPSVAFMSLSQAVPADRRLEWGVERERHKQAEEQTLPDASPDYTETETTLDTGYQVLN